MLVDGGGFQKRLDEKIDDKGREKYLPDFERINKAEENKGEDDGFARRVVKGIDGIHQRRDVVITAVNFPELVKSFLGQFVFFKIFLQESGR